MKKYYYNVYDTIIASEMEILNLPVIEGNEEAGVEIKMSDAASSYIPQGVLGTFYSPTICALGASWGTMEVSEGKRILVYLKDGFTTHDAAPFIIGWGFGFLFHEIGYTVFHCSALNVDGKGVIISGVSGAGKSSTALALLQSGAQYLADDMAIMDPTLDMDIIPSYPVQKVCRDVSTQLQEEKLLHISEGRDKFAYYNEKEYCDKRLKASHIILLRIHDGEDIITKEHTGIDKWCRVLECMYLNELFATFGLPEKDKRNCLKIAQAVRVIEISRPRGKDTINEITEIIRNFVNA